MASANQAPKILLSKPGLVTAAKFIRGAGGPDDDASALRSRLPSVGSLNLLTDSRDLQTDRFLPFLTENTEFTVIGVIGPPGVGKSTIMNEIYGFDSSSPGMLPPFGVGSEDTRATARHCTVGIEPRISSERIILLDTQPVFSPSVLAEMVRPDGLSIISVINGESLPAELAHEMMSIQLGILLASICHIVIVVSEGVHDATMWRFMMTVDLLKHRIPDPSSSVAFGHSQNATLSYDKENVDKLLEAGQEYIAAPIFVHTMIRDQDISPHRLRQMKKAIAQSLSSSTFMRLEGQDSSSFEAKSNSDINVKLFLVPSNGRESASTPRHDSYARALGKISAEVLSMRAPSFSRTVSERDWLKNSAKVWDLIRSSLVINEYCRTLQSSVMYVK